MELPSVTGIGRFRAAMALYEDGSFLTPFGLNPILQHDQTMYIGVFLLDKMTGGDNRKLVLKNCWASPSNSSNDEIKEQFLSDKSCSQNSGPKLLGYFRIGWCYWWEPKKVFADRPSRLFWSWNGQNYRKWRDDTGNVWLLFSPVDPIEMLTHQWDGQLSCLLDNWKLSDIITGVTGLLESIFGSQYF